LIPVDLIFVDTTTDGAQAQWIAIDPIVAATSTGINGQIVVLN
jgi:hypothetical protein